MRVQAGVLAAALVAATALTPGSRASAAPLALIHATIIDGTGRPAVSDGTVVIDQGRIVSVGASRTVVVPTGAVVRDETGKFIIPGLMDANVHLFINLDVDTLLRLRGRYDEIVLEGAQISLKNGLTTVFDTWGPYPDLKKARDEINAGRAVGSRIYYAGNIIGLDGPISDDFRNDLKTIVRPDLAAYLNDRWTQGTGRRLAYETAEEVRKEVAAYAAKDVDFLKYASNGHREMSLLAFSQGAQDAVVAAGHEAGKTVQAHVHTAEGIRAALRAGVDILTHCDISADRPLPDAVIKEIAEKGIACSIMPTTKAYQESIPKVMKPFHANSSVNIKKLVAAGVPLMLSTDAGIEHPLPDVPPEKPVADPRTRLGEGHFAALEGLEELGVEPMTILKIATINIARGYRLDRTIGSIEPGKSADLVVLDKNPLAAARNYRTIALVIKAGEVVDRTKLPSAPLISQQTALGAN